MRRSTRCRMEFRLAGCSRVPRFPRPWTSDICLAVWPIRHTMHATMSRVMICTISILPAIRKWLVQLRMLRTRYDVSNLLMRSNESRGSETFASCCLLCSCGNQRTCETILLLVLCNSLSYHLLQTHHHITTLPHYHITKPDYTSTPTCLAAIGVFGVVVVKPSFDFLTQLHARTHTHTRTHKHTRTQLAMSGFLVLFRLLAFGWLFICIVCVTTHP
jgi:hypothetical protein